MIYPYLTYGVLLWGSASKTSLKPIETMQKKDLRIIANTSWDAHTNILFNELKILKFIDIFKYQLAKFAYKPTIQLFVPPIMYPNRNIDIHPYNTRHNNLLHSEFTRTKTLQDSFLIKGQKYWNTLPPNLTDCITIERFLSQLKQHLLTAAYD